ncbi:MAG: MobH family relaxase [Pseudomonadota bacterium]|nr:MobH family relaxase [Pseudomonadota bacterium]MDP1904922.1 MobH family relaxase [Pseudomonadota bacterium]MDP2352045.1 MobH family relaxase [Pseudomonadota bacterium]
MAWWRKKTPVQTPSAQPVYQWGEEEIPRYPPFMKGLPVVPPDKLLETQHELLSRIANTAIATPDIYERHYLAAMKRFASFAHLLPASQSHHHRGAGGLLRHAIEVGLWAMQSADRVLLNAAKTPALRREMEPRWQLAVFLAGMCHDAGKPVTDLTVTDKDRTSTWSPITEDLVTWATRHRINAYFLTWREGRARQHTALSSLIGERIIGAETLSWIAGADTELVVWLMESLASNPSPTNLIHDLVVKADQTSVERDLKTMGVAMAGYDLGVPVERHLTDIMRRLVREGVWFINEPGARLWNIGGHIYLVWPAAGEDLARQVREDGVPGIPRTPDGILDMLVERQIAHVREGAAPGDRLWKIAPAVLAVKIPDIKLPAIRLRDDAMVSAMPIPPVEGRIINEPDAAPPSNAQDAVPPVPAPDIQSPSQTLDPGGQTDGQTEPAAAVGHLPEGDSPCEPALKVNGKTRQKAAVSSTSSNASGHALDDAQTQKAPVATVTAPATAAKKPLETIKPDGAVGEALKALAQDLKASEKIWGRDAVADVDGQVCLKWPDAFAGYGLTAKAILDDLHSREWLWIDPMTPLKRVLDAEFKAGVAKAIRLAPAISQWLIQEADGSDALCEDRAAKAETIEPPTKEANQEPDAPEPEVASPIATPEKPGRKSRRKAARQADTPQEHEPVDPKPEESDGGVKQAPAVVVVANGISTVDEVIAFIKDLPAQAQLDGFCALPKLDVMSACKRGGMNLTHKRLADLCQQEPGRLHADGNVIRYRV